MASEFILIFLLNYLQVIIYYVANKEKSIWDILWTIGKSKNDVKQLMFLTNEFNNNINTDISHRHHTNFSLVGQHIRQRGE